MTSFQRVLAKDFNLRLALFLHWYRSRSRHRHFWHHAALLWGGSKSWSKFHHSQSPEGVQKTILYTFTLVLVWGALRSVSKIILGCLIACLFFDNQEANKFTTSQIVRGKPSFWITCVKYKWYSDTRCTTASVEEGLKRGLKREREKTNDV